MNKPNRSAVLLLIAAVTPVSMSADLIDISDMEMTAFASFNKQGSPEQSAFDSNSGPFGSLARAEVLVLAQTRSTPFPNVPTSQTQAFGSSATNANGFYAVGVSGFFFQNSLPPNALVASGTATQTITNNSGVAISGTGGFEIPAPTIRFFGVGNSFAPGADPARDATAAISIRFVTKLTHPDGSAVETILVDYGMRSFREPVSGVLVALPTSSDAVGITRFAELGGSFGFRLPDLKAERSFGNIGPGDSMEVTYDYFAQASTGFGETGVFAAIGDPFNLSASGGRFDIQVGPATGVPEPATLATLAVGMVVLGYFLARRGRRSP
jgi:hypothetical protein